MQHALKHSLSMPLEQKNDPEWIALAVLGIATVEMTSRIEAAIKGKKTRK